MKWESWPFAAKTMIDLGVVPVADSDLAIGADIHNDARDHGNDEYGAGKVLNQYGRSTPTSENPD